MDRYPRIAAGVRMIGAVILWSSVVMQISSAQVPAADPVEPGRRAVPAGFVNLGDFIPGMLIDVKYAGNDNFMGRILDGYGAPKALLLEGPAKALREVNDSLKKKGYRLKVFDAYRPMRAERDMIGWAGGKEERKTISSGKAMFRPGSGRVGAWAMSAAIPWTSPSWTRKERSLIWAPPSMNSAAHHGP